jgi:hypothetical protein
VGVKVQIRNKENMTAIRKQLNGGGEGGSSGGGDMKETAPS